MRFFYPYSRFPAAITCVGSEAAEELAAFGRRGFRVLYFL